MVTGSVARRQSLRRQWARATATPKAMPPS